MNATRPLQNRVAMVSGASGGMGQAICAQLAQAGAQVVMLGRDLDRLRQAREQLARQWGIGDLLSIQQIDIRDASSVSQAIAAQGQALGTPDMLVHAAGDGPVAPLLEATEAMWQATIQGKLLGTIRLTRAVAAGMVARKSGRIVIINGVFGREPDPLFPINSTVNAGLAAFGKASAHDLGRHGICVNVINPGATDTPLWADISQALASRLHTTADAVSQQVRDKVPLGRLAAPDDVAALVVFLASAGGQYINGAAITVDGGASAAI